jgi:ParB-like chromosome segregation protein Spo0J
MKILMKSAPIEIHPYAKIMPRMTTEEFNDLYNDIEKMGQVEPGVIYQDMILDGSNRYAVTQKLGIDFQYVEFRGDDKAALNFVISKNVIRRHLTQSQKAAVGAEMANLKNGQNARWETRGSANLHSLRHQPLKNTTVSKLVSIEEAAKILDVSERSIKDAKKVKQKDPVAFDKIKSGELTVNKAVVSLNVKPTKKEVFSSISNTSSRIPTLYDQPIDLLQKSEQGFLIEIRVAEGNMTRAFEYLFQNSDLQIPSGFREGIEILKNRFSELTEKLAKKRKSTAEIVTLKMEK